MLGQSSFIPRVTRSDTSIRLMWQTNFGFGVKTGESLADALGNCDAKCASCPPAVLVVAQFESLGVVHARLSAIAPAPILPNCAMSSSVSLRRIDLTKQC